MADSQLTYNVKCESITRVANENISCVLSQMTLFFSTSIPLIPTLLLCGRVVVYTIGTHNVARAHAPHCAAAESDFGLCPSLSLAGLLAHTVHRRFARTYRTYSFQRVSLRGICSTAVCIGFHSFVCTYMTVCLYVTFECSTENLQLEKLESIAGIMKWLHCSATIS